MFELAVSPSRVSWIVAIAWFMILVGVGEAAMYLDYTVRQQYRMPRRAGVQPEPPGHLSFVMAAAVPLGLAPMMMLRPPGEVSVWLAGSALLWAGAWLMVGLVHVGSADRAGHRVDEVIDLRSGAKPIVIDLRERIEARVRS